MIAIGDVDQQGPDDFLVLRRGREVDRLIHVVGGCVIALGQPIFENCHFSRAGPGRNAHDHRRNAVADEVVLITANEKIAQRFRIRLNSYPMRLGNGAHAIAEIGVVKPQYGEKFQGHDRKKHIDIDIGGNGFGRDSRMRGKVFRAEESFLFSGDQHQK